MRNSESTIFCFQYKNARIGPVDDNILIAELQLGHEIDIVMHAMKGIAADHSKFSPVGKYAYNLYFLFNAK